MAITSTQQTEILKIVSGLFNAAPGGTYLTELANLVSGGMTTSQLADALAAHSLFTGTVMAGKVTTSSQVNVLMKNFGLTADSDPASAGSQAQAYFTQQINAGVGFGKIVYDAVQFLSGSVPPEFATAATLLSNKALVAAAYSDSNSSSSLTTLQGVVANVTGTAAYTDADVTTVLTNAGTGSAVGQTFTLTTGANKFTGDSGDDTFDAGLSTSSLQTLNSGDQLAGGTGTDELYAVINGSVTPAAMSSIENVSITNITHAATIDFSNASGITSLVNQGSTVALTISGVSTDLGITVQDTSIAGQAIVYANVTGSADSATVKLQNVTDAATLTAANIETLTLNSAGSTSNVLANLLATSATTIDITGTQALTFTAMTNASAATVIDASANSGGVTMSPLTVTATSISGGSGNDAITRTIAVSDSISAGEGNDTVTFTGAGRLDAADTIYGGDGTDDLVGNVTDLTALTIPTTAIITGFEEITISDALAGNTLTTANVQAGIDTVELAVANAGASVITFEAGTKTVNLTAGLSTTGLTVNDTGVATTDSLTIANNGSAVDALNGLAVAVNGFETVNITTSGTGGAATQQDVATITLAGDGSATTTLNISGSNSLVTTGIITANVIDASGLSSSAVLTMGAAGASITSITGSGNADTLVGDASSSIDGGAGSDTITGGSGNDTLIGGTGADTITTGGGSADSVSGGTGNDIIVATLTAGNTIVGGDGTDVLSLAVAATAATATGVSGFETLRDTAGITQDMALLLDNSTITTLSNAGVTSTFNNVSAAVSGYANTATGSTATITRLVDSTANSLTVTGLTGTTLTALTANNEETISLGSSGTGAVVVTTLTDTDLTTLNITGSGLVTITTLAANSTTAGSTLTIDGSTNTAGVSVSAVNSTLSAAVTGSGTASSTITGGGGSDTIIGGAAADTIAGGVGADTLTGGAGADTFRVTSTVASYTGGTPGTSGLFETISDYELGSDIIDDTTAALALSTDATTTASSGVAGITLATGIATFNVADSTLELRVAAVNASLLAGTEATGQIAIFTFGSDTYVYVYDDTADTVAALDGLIKLTGVTGVTASDLATSAGNLILS